MLRNSIDKMNNIFESIVDFMEENGSIQKEYRDVYLFALQTIVVYIINIGSGVIIGVFMGELFYCVIFLLAFILLRQEAGGYHAPGWKSCYFLSCGILILTLLWIKAELIYQEYITGTAAFISGMNVLFFAPLEDKNKPLEELQKKAVRKKARIMVAAEMAVGVIFLFFEKKAAYAVWSSVIWCGVSYMAWAVKRYAERNV